MRLRVTLELHGKTATGFEVPPEAVEELGAGKRPPVAITINGHTYRSTVATMGGRFMLGVSAENRAAAGVTAGESVDLVLELDTAPREVEVPEDLAAALEGAAVRDAFDRLAPSHKKEAVRSVEDAKKPETRQRRIEATLQRLRAG